MSNQPNHENQAPTIQEIIGDIVTKSTDGGYIYRGERRTHKGPPYHGKVSSSLWRDFKIEDLDVEYLQEEVLRGAKKHMGQLPRNFRPTGRRRSRFLNIIQNDFEETIDFEILTELQHYGGKTNLIDFTTDYLIALFFASDGHHDKDGRIILQKTIAIEDMIWYPQNPRHRVVVQKSVFVRPPKGFIEPHEDELIIIPANLKQPLLEHLRKFHEISKETIYNDLHGFIRNQDNHESASLEYAKGFASQSRGFKTSTTEEKQIEYKRSVTHYNKAIKLDPEIESAYSNRGEAVRHGYT